MLHNRKRNLKCYITENVRIVFSPEWARFRLKIDIGKPIDKSIIIDEANLIIVDCIDQSIKIGTHTVLDLNSDRFYLFYQFYRPQC